MTNLPRFALSASPGQAHYAKSRVPERKPVPLEEPRERFDPVLPEGAAWHVVYTNPKCEHRALMGLKEQGYHTYLPTMRLWVKHSHTRREVERPLFPRYLFVGFAPMRTSWYPIRSTDGIAALITNGNTPMRVPAGRIASLADAEFGGWFDRTISGAIRAIPDKPLYEAGTEVEIVSGPFTGFVATVIAAPPNKRVELLMNIFGRQSVGKVALEDIRAVC